MLKRGWGVLFLLVVALTLAMITGHELMYTVAYVLAALFVISLLISLSNLFGLEVRRHVRTRRSQVGKPAIEDVCIRNRGLLPKLWLEFRDLSNLPNHRVGRVITVLAAGKQYLWNVRTSCVRRGRFTVGPAVLRSGDPFGLFILQRSLPQTASIVVFPATVDIPLFPLVFGDLPGGDAMRRRTHHITDNVAGVRDYAYGDSFNRIHWKSTARTDRLIVKEFELDPTTDVWIYLDLDHGVHVTSPFYEEEYFDSQPLLLGRRSKLRLIPSTEEYTVTVAASLVNYFLKQGRAVGMTAYGQSREVIQADRGSRQLARILETLSVIEAKGSLPFHQIMLAEGERLARGTTIVAITSSAETDWIYSARDLARRGIRVVAVLIQANSFAPAPHLATAFSELSASQIRTFVVERDAEIGAALATPVAGAMDETSVRREAIR